MQADYPAVHLSGDQQSAHAESRLLRRNGPKPFPFLRHNPRRLVWSQIRSLPPPAASTSFHFDNFASLLLTISFGFAMVNYYSTPIPGIGTSFHNLITDESQFLANKINQTELQTVDRTRSPTSKRAWIRPAGGYSRNGHLRRRHHPARRSPGHRHRRHRLRIHRHRCLRACGPGLHSVLYRSETGVALLGLVPLLHPICLLPGHRRSRCLCHRQI